MKMNKEKKYAFIDRDGTLIVEPVDTKQVNSLQELYFLPKSISSLLIIQEMGYELIIVSNQDNLGTAKNPKKNYEVINKKILDILESEGVVINHILACPHREDEKCNCRKPHTGLVSHFLDFIDTEMSFMVGDRRTDMQFAQNLDIKGFLLTDEYQWKDIVGDIKKLHSRKSSVRRTTKETDIELHFYLDGSGSSNIKTGLDFFDHMLDQFAKHGQFDLNMIAHKNDLEIDEHHLIEDVAICLGQAYKESLQNKRGIERYSYEWLLPMDEANSYVTVDLSGRPYLEFEGKFSREYVGDFPTEMLQHFYHTFAMHAGLTLHIRVAGANNHHQVECSFKSFAKCLHKASRIVHDQISSTKGTL